MIRPTYTISVSKIELFNKFLHRQTEDNEMYNNEANFLATLRGEFKQLPSARYGDCFHAIIEGKAQYSFDYLDEKEIRGWKFGEVLIPEAQAKHAIGYRQAHDLSTDEIPLSKLYRTNDFDIIVTGRVDKLEGNWIRDAKTKYSSPDMQEDYIDSLQWRFYLDMLGLDVFFFDIFQISGFKEVKDCLTAKIKPLEPLMCKRYPTMKQDVEYALQELANYLQFKGLLGYAEIPITSPLVKDYNLYPDLSWSDDTVLNFGKHRGKRLGDVPQYLQWLYSNKPLPVGMKQYMREKGLVT